MCDKNGERTKATNEAEPTEDKIDITRRTILVASPLSMLTPGIASLLSSREVAAAALAAGNNLPGHWSPTDPNRPAINGPIGDDLWRRADKVLPSKAMFLTRTARFAGYNVIPGFFKDAKGCRVIDVDDVSYIDYTCCNGIMLLGYQHQAVDKAAKAQAAKGDVLPFFAPAMIELCERLLEWIDGFDWAVPVKRGSDATELAMRVARAKTRRPSILMFKRSYHGSNVEQSLYYEGVPSDGLEHIPRIAWNDIAALDDYPADKAAQVAAILMSPLDQDSGIPCVFPTPEFIAAVHRFKARTGAYIILDDVRGGFRLHPEGSHNRIGLRPDLICFGKGLGNGHSQAAIIGTEPLRTGAEQLLYTSTTFFSSVCSRAAIATLDAYEQENAFDKMERAGKRLIAGIRTAAEKHGQSIHFSGPVTQPTMLFADDPYQVRGETFSHKAATLGALLHPREPWMLSSAHDDAAIDETIDIVDKALAAK